MLAEETVIRSDLTEARDLEERLLEEVRRQGFLDAGVFAVKLALEEGLVNAIKHGNRYAPDKRVRIRYDITPEQAEFTIIDEGEGFRPCDVPDPTSDENIMKPCGRGIMLMRSFMDVVEYNESGNVIHLVKRNSASPGSQAS